MAQQSLKTLNRNIEFFTLVAESANLIAYLFVPSKKHLWCKIYRNTRPESHRPPLKFSTSSAKIINTSSLSARISLWHPARYQAWLSQNLFLLNGQLAECLDPPHHNKDNFNSLCQLQPTYPRLFSFYIMQIYNKTRSPGT